MADIICPICNRVNESSAERCWYCHAILVKNQPAGIDNDLENRIDNPQAGTVQNSTVVPDSGKNEEVPDWLARIRQLEKEGREQTKEPNPFHDAEPQKDDRLDWLNEFRLEGESGSESAPEQPKKDISQGNEPKLFSKETLLQQPSAEKNEDISDGFDSLLAELGIGAVNSLETESTFQADDEIAATGSDQAESDYLDRLGFEEHLDLEGELSQSEINPDKIEPLPISSEESEVIPEFPWEEERITFSEEAREPVEESQSEIETEPVSQSEPNIEPVTSADVEPARDGEQHTELPSLDSSGIMPPGTGELRPVSFDDDDLPEWLSLDQPEPVKKTTQRKVESAPDIELDAGKLEKAHLPAWLHAIRPVEAVTPLQPAPKSSVAEEKPAEEGILAGIEGVLHSADLSNQIKKPLVYSSGIEVSDRQRQNVALFKALLEGVEPENMLGTSPKTPGKSNLILRIVVTLVLLTAVLLPIFSYTPFGITPVLFPAEVVSTFSNIQNLQSGKPILLAAHFEAGLAGEMKWASRAVIEHLMARNIPMALISTNAIGYAVLEDEIRDISLTETGYLVDDQVVNFGYLPGGTLGILSLTQNLHQALPYTTSIQPAWTQPVLQGVNNLSDFGAVIVFTDNADIVKTWVEQAGTSIGVPLILAVVSAQAAPMTQPYYDSGQIMGFVAGMNGSQAYEQIMQRPYSSTLVFGSFQLTLLVTALIIFIGGAVSMVLSSGTGIKKGGGK